MAENIKSSLEQITNSELRKLLDHILTKLDEKDAHIHHLENRVTDLELRVSEQERYSSNDCLIFTNLPINPDENLWTQTVKFLQEYMEYPIRLEQFKACHFLGSSQKNKTPPVIVKFLYFHDKNEIYYRRQMLGSKLNPFNYLFLFPSDYQSTIWM